MLKEEYKNEEDGDYSIGKDFLTKEECITFEEAHKEHAKDKLICIA